LDIFIGRKENVPEKKINIVVPGDDPIQIMGSPELERLAPYGEVTLYSDRPADTLDKVRRAKKADIIMNTRSQQATSRAQNDHHLLHRYGRL
jgi:hypothetical protein